MIMLMNVRLLNLVGWDDDEDDNKGGMLPDIGRKSVANNDKSKPGLNSQPSKGLDHLPQAK